MAQGYSMITRKAQAVLVHAGIGVLQFGGALHNAHRGRTPVLLASGRAPYTFENELAGGKDSPHHWDQELFDQPGSLREYTKWQYEVRTNANLRQVVARALQIANSEPQGESISCFQEICSQRKQIYKAIRINPSTQGINLRLRLTQTPSHLP